MSQREPDLPYGRQWIDDADAEAVAEALRSPRIAHGPRVAAFEAAFAEAVGAGHAVACSSGTAALHLALAALDVREGDICVVPATTFLATATAARFCGAEVAFVDVDPETGLMTPETLGTAVAEAGPAARAVLPVHLGGRLCDMPAISAAARSRGLQVVEDACHALGGTDAAGTKVGASHFSEAAAFSVHPVKIIAAGEGGLITTGDAARAGRMRRLRNHGVTADPALFTNPGLSLSEDGAVNPWSYEQIELGFNYRMNELEAALGLSQLAKLERFVHRRLELSRLYDERLRRLEPVVRPIPRGGGRPGMHLYQVLIDFDAAGVPRSQVIRGMAEKGVQTQVHYIPLYRQPYFRGRYGDMSLPGAEAFYARVLALPLFPAMVDADVDRVVDKLEAALG
ncbi:MAG TPA: UDP-4-amino-4,6-dideoxy-N-acetyl-beta-L-altrosamine transaminase [Caulobacteraceae bacterium]|jgi:UDP-4-amino-4,6-dideoxy-N-acetyl-beta-L-altrosamine transaminase